MSWWILVPCFLIVYLAGFYRGERYGQRRAGEQAKNLRMAIKDARVQLKQLADVLSKTKRIGAKPTAYTENVTKH